MTTRQDVDMAILSMHTYNTGALNRHINGISTIAIGEYQYVSSFFPTTEALNSGFSASAFRLVGGLGDPDIKVLAIRGTNPNESWNDATGGYLIGLGQSVLFSSQTQQALAAYQSLVGVDEDNYSASIQLTGHSLGGGIAGYLGTIYGKQATIFDHMAYYGSATDDHFVATASPNSAVAGFLYPDGDNRPTNAGNVKGYATTGEFLSVNRELSSGASAQYLNSYSGLEDPAALHSMALQVALQWASHNDKTSWHSAGSSVWSAFLGNDVAATVAEASVMAGADGSALTVLQEVIAYSAISSGNMPFGNTAIYSLFDDATDLATALDQPNATGLPSLVLESIGRVTVEYAARLAIGKVLMDDDADARSGILDLNSSQSTLTVLFNDNAWTFSGVQHESSFKEELIFSSSRGKDASFDLFSDLNLYALKLGISTDPLDLITSVSFQAQTNPNSYVVPTSGLNILFLQSGNIDLSGPSQSNDRIVVGADSGTYFVGGDGNDITIGGIGADTFGSSRGDDIFDGGGYLLDTVFGSNSIDTVSYNGSPKPITITYSYNQPSSLVVNDGFGATDHLVSIEKIIGTTGRDILKIVGSIAQDTDLLVDANGGQGAHPQDTINVSKSDGSAWIVIPDGSGEGYIETSLTGGRIKLAGFHTGIVGSDYDDTISDQSTGHKRIDGGQGNDTISAGGDGAILLGGDGDDTLTGGGGNDLLDGGWGVSAISGGAGSDRLIARGSDGAGTDTLDGGEGADYLESLGSGAAINGGAGNDVIDLRNGDSPVITFGLGGGHDYVLTQDASNEGIRLDLSSLSKDDVSFIFSSDVDLVLLTQPIGNPIDIAGMAFIIGDLTIKINSSGESITFQNVSGHSQFYGYTYDGLNDLIRVIPDIPEISFADGTMTRDDFYSEFSPRVTFSDTSAYRTAPADYAAAVATSSADTTGTSDDDSLTGGLGDDSISGGAGDDEINASGGTDIIDGGDGNDTIVALGSSWQFAASIEDARISLTDTSGPEGKLKLTSVEAVYFLGDDVTTMVASGTAQSDVLQGEGSSILYGAGGDDILIAGDGPAQLLGGAGSDQLTGGALADVFTGGTGNDMLEGNDGSDWYLWSIGDGDDTIVDATAYGDWNELSLQNVVSAAVELDRDGNDLLLTIVASGEVIRIKDHMLGDDSRGLNGIAFSDGQYWDRAAILDHLAPTVIEGTDGSDNLVGSNAAEIFYGGLGNDTIADSGGNDVYWWDTGDGNDFITSSSGWASQSDTIRFGAGITPSDVIIRHELAGPGGQSRISANVGSGGSVTINGVSPFDSREVMVRFADGTIWNKAMLLQKADANPTLITGTTGADTLNGSNRADLIDGLAGNDFLYGAEGSDTYVYRSGDGNDVISDYSSGSGGLPGLPGMPGPSGAQVDTLDLIDLNQEDVTIQRVQNQFGAGNDLLVTDTTTGHSVRIEGHFNSNNNSKIEQIRFANGSTLDSAAIAVQANNIYGTAGDDYFSLNWSGFTLTPGAGDDVITVNGTGGGTIVFSANDGHDILQSSLGSDYQRADILDIQDLNPSDVTFSRIFDQFWGDKLVITVNSTGATFEAVAQFNNYGEQAGLNEIHFSDNTVWSRYDIDSAVQSNRFDYQETSKNELLMHDIWSGLII